MTDKPSIKTRAILCHVTIGYWAAEVFDNSVTVATRKAHGAKVGAWKKPLFSRQVIAPLRQAHNALKKHYYDLTLPYQDRGMRLLPMGERDPKTKRRHGEQWIIDTNRLIDKYEQAVAKFGDTYYENLSASDTLLGDTFNADDYPKVHDVINKYYATVEYAPLPVITDDLRLALDDAQLDHVISELELSVKVKYETAMQGAWDRLFKVCDTMYNGLRQTDKGFNDTLISNVKNLVKLLPSFNIMGDDRLDTLAAEAEKRLTQYEAHELKSDLILRQTVADAAQDVSIKVRAIQQGIEDTTAPQHDVVSKDALDATLDQFKGVI